MWIFFRGLHTSSAKIQALDVLLEISTYCSAETILDRIVPYIVSINYRIQQLYQSLFENTVYH